MAEILREIGMIARALDSIANIEFKEYDLTRGQYLYLIRICENPGIIQEKLAEMIKVDRIPFRFPFPIAAQRFPAVR